MFSKITDKMSDEKLNRVHFISHMLCLFCITICSVSVFSINYMIYKSVYYYIISSISIVFFPSIISKMRSYKNKSRFDTEYEIENTILLSFAFIAGTLFIILRVFPLLQYQLI